METETWSVAGFRIEVLRFPVNDGSGGLYDEQALHRGVERGVLSVDTRVRDALRALASGHAPEFGRTDLVEEARFVADLSALGETDIAHARARMDELEARLSAVESELQRSRQAKAACAEEAVVRIVMTLSVS